MNYETIELRLLTINIGQGDAMGGECGKDQVDLY